VLAFDLRQSMENGGGPACLRLRVALTKEERAAIGETASAADLSPPSASA
jgi:succinylarginine dihydrolase